VSPSKRGGRVDDDDYNNNNKIRKYNSYDRQSHSIVWSMPTDAVIRWRVCVVCVYLCPHRVTCEGSRTSRISRIYRSRRRGAEDNIHSIEIVFHRDKNTDSIRSYNICWTPRWFLRGMAVDRWTSLSNPVDPCRLYNIIIHTYYYTIFCVIYRYHSHSLGASSNFYWL